MKLLYKNIMIGRINEAFESDGTWFGMLALSEIDPKNIEVSRVLQFIKFCESWNESQTSQNPRIAEEFDAFSDMIGDGLWQVDDGWNRLMISQSPNFQSDSEVSWTTETSIM